MTDTDLREQGTRRNAVRKLAIIGSAAFLGLGRARANPPSTISILPLPGPRAGKCLLQGTAVQTTRGEAKVEDLTIGDLLPTMFGGAQPIQWIGRYPIRRSNLAKPWPNEALPVLIARSALGPNVPHKDLYVSQAHCLFFDGVLIQAGCLINETTITLVEASECNEFEYFHIKLEKHDVITAEGAPVETLLDVDESAVNFVEYYRAHGAPTKDEVPCVPILSIQRRGSGLKARIRSAASWIDRRKQIGAIRDRLAERGATLSREAGLICQDAGALL